MNYTVERYHIYIYTVTKTKKFNHRIVKEACRKASNNQKLGILLLTDEYLHDQEKESQFKITMLQTGFEKCDFITWMTSKSPEKCPLFCTIFNRFCTLIIPESSCCVWGQQIYLSTFYHQSEFPLLQKVRPATRVPHKLEKRRKYECAGRRESHLCRQGT